MPISWVVKGGRLVYAGVQALRITKSVSVLARASTAALKAASQANKFVVPLKHLSSSAGRYSKFAASVNPQALVREALQSNAAKFFPNSSGGSHIVITDLGRAIGSKGQTSLKVVFDEIGNIWTAYPIK